MNNTPHDTDEFVEATNEARRLMLTLRRSIRASITSSKRNSDSHADGLLLRAAAFGQTLEWRNEELGWNLGALRVKASGLLQNELAQVNESFLVHAQAHLTVAEHLNSQAASTWRKSTHALEKLDVLCELHGQAIIVAQEILALLAAGLPTGAMSRWRTLYELAVTGRFLARSPRDVAVRYVASHIAELKRLNDLELKDSPTRRRGLRAELREQDRILSEDLNRLVSLHGREIAEPYGWAAKRLGLKRVKFSDIETRVRAGGFRIHPNGDRSLYKEASQHIHGERASSLKTMVRADPSSALLVGGTLVPYRIQATTVWTFQSLTWTLGALVSRTQKVDEAMYWAYVAHMYALDADTESIWSMYRVDTGFLRGKLSVD